ncbi:RNA polymerase sigma factor [Planomonospora sp. ID82291]|uniref:RNA polymerase sigma factor n=1 Tax=Planomonospora sp. ID82291 TaxID=2738136 RepID=UPI0018C37468|nr:sigma-70 family RNA polymerase sigma factor [Planomonospora sp. ID82291]MBG0814491.1 sigma-70 family RNA polymerase sigma factor [Planomonospora sp. ID82291]
MNDSVLVEALRARDAGALAALYDSYAEGVYGYCRSLLDDPDGAQVALRDTLITAEDRVHVLTDAGRLKAWLYALAREQCLRLRLAAEGQERQAPAEEPPVPRGGDADLRVVAWNAVRGLSEEDREILELVARHDLDVADAAAVMRIPDRDAERMLEAAKDRLRDAVTAEFLARKGPYDCAERAEILGGFSGELTSGTRERMIAHVNRCDGCSPHRSRQISAVKVFDLLPGVTLPDTVRVRVMSCFTDPELVPYRRYAAGRIGVLDAAGFPAARVRRDPRRARALAGAAAAVAVAAATAMILVNVGGGPGGEPSGIASGVLPAVGGPPGVRLPWQVETGERPMALESAPPELVVHALGPTGPGRTRQWPGAAGPEAQPDRLPPGAGPDRPGPAGPAGPAQPSWRPVPPAPDGPPDGRPTAPVQPPRDHQGGRPGPKPCPTPKPAPSPAASTSTPKPPPPPPAPSTPPSTPPPASSTPPPTPDTSSTPTASEPPAPSAAPSAAGP